MGDDSNSPHQGLDGVLEVIQNKDEEWSTRSKALQQIHTFFTKDYPSVRNKEQIHSFIKYNKDYITLHMNDRRSILTKDVCAALTAIAAGMYNEPMFLTEILPAFLLALSQQLKITIKAISESSHKAVQSILKSAGNYSTSTSSQLFYPAIHLLCDLMSGPHPQTRAKSAEYIGILLETPFVSSQILGSTNTHNDEIIDSIDSIISKSLSDAHPEARSNGKKSQNILYKYTHPSRTLASK
jgi:hypothetical protein